MTRVARSFATCALLEHALAASEPAWSLEAGSTRWWGLSSLETRALAAAAPWRALRAAAGLSQTGEPELGWTSLAASFGGATPGAGAAVRVLARSERDSDYRVARAFSARAGYEAGGGAWLEPASGMRVWASAPQMFTHGPAPPLARPLELGVRVGGASAAWATLVSPRAGDDGTRALGVSLAVDPLTVWAEVRDAPLRGAAGLAAGWGPLALEARVDAHPVLGETARVSLAWSHAGRASP